MFHLDNLVLPNPDFNDTNTYTQTRVQRTPRLSSDLIVFKEDFWPQSQSINITFSYLTELQIYQLKQLIKVTIGKIINIIDQYSLSWQAIITNPEAEISQADRAGYSITINLEVIL